jgi:hypothetical protein
MKRIAWTALGALIFLASLWGGSFFMYWLGWGHWAHFPTLITSLLMACLSVFIVARSIDS